MLFHAILEDPGSVLSVSRWDDGKVLINRQALVEVYAASDGSLAVAKSWHSAEPIAHAVCLPGQHALVIARSGACAVVDLSGERPRLVSASRLGAPTTTLQGAPSEAQLEGMVLSGPCTASSAPGATTFYAASFQHNCIHLVRLAPAGGSSLGASPAAAPEGASTAWQVDVLALPAAVTLGSMVQGEWPHGAGPPVPS